MTTATLARRLASCLVVLTVAACAPSHAGRTLGRGTIQLEAGLGGPFFTNFGGAVPVPNIPVGVRYGVTDRLDVQGHANLLPLVVGGFLQMDAGVTYSLMPHRARGRDGLNLATSVSLALLTDFDTAARAVPFFDLAGGYTWRWFTAFMGVDVWLDFSGDNVAANPYVGVELDIRHATISLAGVWYNPALDADASAVNYVSGVDQGGIGVQLGVKYRWDLSALPRTRARRRLRAGAPSRPARSPHVSPRRRSGSLSTGSDAPSRRALAARMWSRAPERSSEEGDP